MGVDRKFNWHVWLGNTLTGEVSLIMSRKTATLVANALEIVNPESKKATETARALALAIQNLTDSR